MDNPLLGEVNFEQSLDRQVREARRRVEEKYGRWLPGGETTRGEVVCPRCGAPLRFVRVGTTGHVFVRCDTPKCLVSRV